MKEKSTSQQNHVLSGLAQNAVKQKKVFAITYFIIVSALIRSLGIR